MRALSLVVPLVALAACKKPPVEAPAELGALGLFLFQHFEDEDPAELQAGLLNLRPFVEAEDLSIDAMERAVTMPVLDGAALGGLSIPDGAEVDAQVPVALGSRSTHDVDAQRALAVEPNQVCIESSSTVWAGREFLTDEACFGDGSCDTLDTVTEVRKENFLAKVWYDQYKNYRALDLEDEEGVITKAIVGRAWIEEVSPGDGGSSSWDQLFHLDVYLEDPADAGQTLRWFSMWSSITLPALSDDAYSNLVVEGIADSYVYGDEFIEGAIETCPNDRALAKPARE